MQTNNFTKPYTSTLALPFADKDITCNVHSANSGVSAKLRLVILFVLLVIVYGEVLGQSTSATYNAGNIPTDFGFQSLPGNSTCPGTLIVNIPLNAIITRVDVQYTISSGAQQPWISDQRSQLRCVSPGGTAETTISSGVGNNAGTYNYSRTGLNIANGVSGGGNITFELHAGRTWNGNGGPNCSLDYHYVNNNTWKVTVFYDGPGQKTYNSSGSFFVPVGVTSINVQTWGGGGGAGTSTNDARGGGGGGAYASKTFTGLTAGTNFPVTVGAGGSPGSNGTSSYFNNNNLTDPNSVVAAGGNAGGDNGGDGGTTAYSNGTTKNAGGTGGNRNAGNGGGGGGQAGCASATGTAGQAGGATDGGFGGGQTGNTGICGTIGAGGNGGGDAGEGASNNGSNGTLPGGGGGGCGDNSSGGGNGVSGTGAKGQVIVTYNCPEATISYSAASFCKFVTTPQNVTITGTAGGTFSAPVGLSINSSTGEINPSTSTAESYMVHYQIAAAYSCPAVDATTTVTINGSPVASVTYQKNISCNAANDGTIEVTASNGAAPYLFSVNGGADGTWQDATTGDDKSLFKNLLPDHPYRIKVKDANECISK
jgi:hypothetical protein